MGLLENLQSEVYELIRDRQELSGVKILNQSVGNLANKTEVHVEEKFGLCVVVLPPIPLSFRNNLQISNSASVQVVVRVVENLDTNRSGLNVLRVAEFIHNRIIVKPFHSIGDVRSLLPIEKNPWQLKENFPEDSRVEILLTYETEVTWPHGNFLNHRAEVALPHDNGDGK
ncbi:MAG: hypothetical protein LBG86_00895 [Puniceicoccales bacterium]|jgi:hypothetical protein|nr:hypothetical protein [Puniceicoccales bacterium]